MRLLVVEDEKHLNKTITERLTKAGYTVDNCFDGEDALYYIENAQYDGILLDVMMPKINGFDVLRIIRSKKILTPVLMLTAKDSDEDIVTGLDLVGTLSYQISLDNVEKDITLQVTQVSEKITKRQMDVFRTVESNKEFKNVSLYEANGKK